MFGGADCFGENIYVLFLKVFGRAPVFLLLAVRVLQGYVFGVDTLPWALIFGPPG